jgi:hypothetical protein
VTYQYTGKETFVVTLDQLNTLFLLASDRNIKAGDYRLEDHYDECRIIEVSKHEGEFGLTVYKPFKRDWRQHD